MNLKIDQQHLTFKITQDELNTLCEGSPLKVQTTLIDINITPTGHDKSMHCTKDKDHNINLTIAQDTLNELSNMGRNKEGITQQIDEMSITLQVDIRKRHSK